MNMALDLAIIAFGGGMGAVTRYLVTIWAAERFGSAFPYGTLLVNVAGSFIIGLFMTLFLERLELDPQWRLERLLLLTQDVLSKEADVGCDVYVVHQGEAAERVAFGVAGHLRQVGLDVVLHCAGADGLGSFKSQMKKADAAQASYALIIGEDEVNNGTLTIKHLRGDASNPTQVTVPSADAAQWLLQAIAGTFDE